MKCKCFKLVFFANFKALYMKDIRVLRGFSIEDVAKGTGLRDGTIKNIEAGKFSADFDIIDKIAQFFNLELALI